MTRVLAAVAIVLAGTGPAAAASLALTHAQKQAAIQAGERSITSEAFGGEWEVTGPDGEHVRVLTPFHRVALAARNAAFQGKTLEAKEAERLARDHERRLVLWVALRGAREDFARLLVPRLVVGDREVKAAFVQNERTAARQEDGRFVARCVYAFPTRDIDGTGRAELVIADADGRELRRFAIDLSRMR